MRAFNELVLDQTIRNTAEVVSPPEFNDRLGRADTLTYEIEVEESSGTSPTITVRHLQSNSGKQFLPQGTLVNAVSIATGVLPYRAIVSVAGPLAGLGQVGVALGGTTPVARVRVWACGRSS